MMNQKIHLIPSSEFKEEPRLWQGIPGIERMRGGRLWASWYTGGPTEGPGNYVVLATSGDDGQTWREPVLIVAPPEAGRCFDPCLWVDPVGRLWLFWAQSNQWWDGAGGVWAIRTDDANVETPIWSEPRRLCDGIMMNKPTVLSTGEWLLPAAVWKTPDSTHAVASTDHGKTWTLRGSASVPKVTCDEHMFVERRDGSIWALIRTEYGIGESISPDRGMTWSPGTPSRLFGPDSRFFIRRLHSGALLLVNHDSVGQTDRRERRSRLTAWISDDDGFTWEGGLLLDERSGVSYPDGTLAADGRIFIVYDRERGAGPWQKEGRIGAREILLAVFNEKDVRAGKCLSTGTSLQMIVNKLPGSDV